MTINILGINITTESKQEILQKISSFLRGTTPRYIVTANPEFLLAAQRDEEFFYILNQADIAVPDGVGLVLAAKFFGNKLRRVAGIDLMYDICALAEQGGQPVFLLGGGPGVAWAAAQKLQQQFPALKIAGAETGLTPGEWDINNGKWIKGRKKGQNLELKIKNSGAEIVFIAFGHPRQEKWIYHALPNLPGVRVFMGVGGSFDFIAGNIKRAPHAVQKMGLEWLWRLGQEPIKRLPRIARAVMVFPWEFFKWRFVKPRLYRPNVACLLFKRENGTIKVLLAERRDQAGHWQLPQGGTDGEDVQTAGSRELREEIGTDKFRPVAKFKNLYYYTFDGYKRQGAADTYTYGYRGQKQSLFIAEFTGADSDITINYWDHAGWQWTDLKAVLDTVHPVRKRVTEIFLEKFKQLIKKEDL